LSVSLRPPEAYGGGVWMSLGLRAEIAHPTLLGRRTEAHVHCSEGPGGGLASFCVGRLNFEPSLRGFVYSHSRFGILATFAIVARPKSKDALAVSHALGNPVDMQLLMLPRKTVAVVARKTFSFELTQPLHEKLLHLKTASDIIDCWKKHSTSPPKHHIVGTW